jgi:hypothetical protein
MPIRFVRCGSLADLVAPSPALPLCLRERTLPIVLVMSEMGHKPTASVRLQFGAYRGGSDARSHFPPRHFDVVLRASVGGEPSARTRDVGFLRPPIRRSLEGRWQRNRQTLLRAHGHCAGGRVHPLSPIPERACAVLPRGARHLQKPRLRWWDCARPYGRSNRRPKCPGDHDVENLSC